MFKKFMLQAMLHLVNGAIAHAATTPDPLDDMVGALLKRLLESLMTAKTRDEVLAAADGAKAAFTAKFPAP